MERRAAPLQESLIQTIDSCAQQLATARRKNRPAILPFRPAQDLETSGDMLVESRQDACRIATSPWEATHRTMWTHVSASLARWHRPGRCCVCTHGFAGPGWKGG